VKWTRKYERKKKIEKEKYIRETMTTIRKT
jgi:hypothetical protein